MPRCATSRGDSGGSQPFVSAMISSGVTLTSPPMATCLVGLIARKDYGVVPPKVEYCLTATGQSFVPVVEAIRKWRKRHLGA